MIIVKVKQSQIAPLITGFKPQATMFVDDAYTKGIKTAFFIAPKSDGTADGVKEATITYAGAAAKTYADLGDANITIPAKAAFGINYEASPVDPMRRRDDFNNETRLYPKGRRQDFKIGFLQDAVVEITDTDNVEGRYFRTFDYTIGTPTSQDNATKTLVFAGDVTSKVRAGDKVKNGANVTFVVSAVFAAGNTTVVTVDGLGDVATETFVLGQIGDVVYLSDDMSGGLPFTTIKPATGSGKIEQPVGWIESTIAVRVKIDPTQAKVV